MALEFITDAFRNAVAPKKSEIVPETEEAKTKSLFDAYGPDEVLFRWSYEGRIPRAQFNPKFLRMFMIIGITVGIFLALMQDFIMLLVIGSTIFFYYVLHNKYVPTEVFYEISKYGFKYGDKLYFWTDIKHFFFSVRGETEFLIFDTSEDLLSRFVVLFHPADKEKIFELLKNKVLFLDKEPKNPVDNFVDFVSSKFNTDVK